MVVPPPIYPESALALPPELFAFWMHVGCYYGRTGHKYAVTTLLSNTTCDTCMIDEEESPANHIRPSALETLFD